MTGLMISLSPPGMIIESMGNQGRPRKIKVHEQSYNTRTLVEMASVWYESDLNVRFRGSEGDRYFFDLILSMTGLILESNSDRINVCLKLDRLGTGRYYQY